MATVNDSIPHIERTSTEPRENRIEPVILSRIDQVNESIRLLRLSPVDPERAIKFTPGQWLDTFIPTLRSAGGFTLTSTPAEAQPHQNPGYLELAVQKSSNPPAQWLWKPETEILGAKLAVRVGGSFTWPPAPTSGFGKRGEGVERLVLVAGGVGVNPLMSIATQILKHTTVAQRPRELHILYTTRLPASRSLAEVLFYERLQSLVNVAAADQNPRSQRPDVSLRLFLTNAREGETAGGVSDGVQTLSRRIKQGDLVSAIDGSGEGGVEGRARTVVYVCGPPGMTDEFVEVCRGVEGMGGERVLCEKWW